MLERVWRNGNCKHNWLKLHIPFCNVLEMFTKIQNIRTMRASNFLSFEVNIPEIKAVQRPICTKTHMHFVALFVVFHQRKEKRGKGEGRGKKGKGREGQGEERRGEKRKLQKRDRGRRARERDWETF